MHANARFTAVGRRTLIDRILEGRPVAHVAAEMGISRPTAYKWWRRFAADGYEGLVDRSSRPRRCPHQTRRVREREVERLRRSPQPLPAPPRPGPPKGPPPAPPGVCPGGGVSRRVGGYPPAPGGRPP